MSKHITKHGSGTITRFDIVGSFFANLFYNELFKKANSLKQQHIDKSTTDIYKELLTAYSEFTERDEFFKQSVRGIHAYIISNTNQIDMTHKECIDFIVKELVPCRIYNSLRDAHKSKLFHETMSTTVKQFISCIIMKYLRMIIDQRGNTENATVLQNEFLDIICTEKDRVYSKFISKSSSTINVEIHKQKVRSLEQEIKKKDTLIAQLTTVNTKAAGVIKQLQKKVIEMKAQLAEPAVIHKDVIQNPIIVNTAASPVVSPVASPVVSPVVSPMVSPSNRNSEPVQRKSTDRPVDDKDDLLFDTSDEYYE
jgi:hypothetical protein